MRTLQNYVTSRVDLPILSEVIIGDGCLTYQGVSYKTSDRGGVQYIGAKNRELARQAKLQSLTEKLAEKQTRLKELEDDELRLKELESCLTLAPTKIQQEVLTNQLNEKSLALESKEQDLVELEFRMEELKGYIPTNSLISDYSLDTLTQLVTTYKQREFMESQLASLQEDLETVYCDIEESEDKRYELEKDIEQNTQERQTLAVELSDLKNNPEQQRLEEKHNEINSQVTEFKGIVSNLKDSLSRLNQRFEDTEQTYASKSKQLIEDEELVSSLKLALGEILQGVIAFEDSVARHSKLSESVLQENNLQLEKRSFDLSSLPNSPKISHIKDYLKDLRWLNLRDLESDTKETAVSKYDSLVSELASEEDSKEKLLETAKNILKLNLFKHVKSTYEEVSSDLAQLKDNMEEENPSLQKFFVEYALAPNQEVKLCLLSDDLESKNNLIESINSSVFKEIENHLDSDLDTSVISELILRELDPRNWFDLTFYSQRGSEPKTILTEKSGSFSTGEKKRCFMTILLSILQVINKQAKQDAPKIVCFDEGFSNLDQVQANALLTKVHNVSDLFLATIPKGTSISAAPNTKRIEIIPISAYDVGGRIVTSCGSVEEYEEFE